MTCAANGGKTQPSLRGVAVYCAAAVPKDPVFSDAAADLGRALARNGIALVYGGSNCGIMKTLADAVLSSGGKAVGVYPKRFGELLHPGLDESVLVDSLAVRKEEMIRRSDAAIVMPGSFGTFDELFDLLARQKLKIARRYPVVLFNVKGFFDPLFELIRKSVEAGFTKPDHAAFLRKAETTDEVLDVVKASGLRQEIPRP